MTDCNHEWKQRANSFVDMCGKCCAQLIPFQARPGMGEWAIVNTKGFGPLPMLPGQLYLLYEDGSVNSPASYKQLKGWWDYIEELQEKVEKLEQQLKERQSHIVG